MERRIITTEVTEEDKVIEPNLRPQMLAEYIGQEKIKNNLKVYIDAAKARGSRWIMCCFTARRDWERRRFPALLQTRWAYT